MKGVPTERVFKTSAPAEVDLRGTNAHQPRSFSRTRLCSQRPTSSRILAEESTSGLGSPGMPTAVGKPDAECPQLQKGQSSLRRTGVCRRVGRAAVWATGISSTWGRARGTGLRRPSALLCEHPRTRTTLGQDFLFLKISLAPRHYEQKNAEVCNSRAITVSARS